MGKKLTTKGITKAGKSIFKTAGKALNASNNAGMALNNVA